MEVCSAGKFTTIQPGLCDGSAVGRKHLVYGAATLRLGELGPSIGWPLSLAMGLLVANLVGLMLGEWKGAPHRALGWMFPGIAVLVIAIVILSKAN